MRVLVDYRPALRHRSGVGEYTARLFGAFAEVRSAADELYVFSSSARDRLTAADVPAGVTLIDRRIPVRLLNFAWHRLEWPPIELLAGDGFDIVHSPHPLLLPSRRAASLVTIHDLDFLQHPERASAEIRRDYAALAERHAHRADHIVVNSAYTAGEVHQRLGVPRHRITVCRAGSPAWTPREATPEAGPILFVGTLEPRKNVGGLLDAYARLLARTPDVPDLVLAGRATPAARGWLDAIRKPPLAGRVHALGYVPDDRLRSLFDRARVLVLPSFEEGFGLPVLEAMTVGVPVVASLRGALPEVLGDAGLLVDPNDPDGIAEALAQLVTDRQLADACAVRGLRRARTFSWAASARALRTAYENALDRRRERIARRAT